MKFGAILLGVLSSVASLCAGAAGFILSSPLDYQVFQRSDQSSGVLIISGQLSEPASKPTKIQVKFGPLQRAQSDGGVSTLGVVQKGESQFSFPSRHLAGGWHRLNVQAVVGATIVGQVVVEHVGIGEIFVIAGQSNSANHGEEKQKVNSQKVSTFDGKSWRIADDPQPGASGRGGSFIPPFANELVRKFKVPVGIVSTGVGATSVREWLPEGERFPNPPTIMNKVVSHPRGGWMSKGEVYRKLISRGQSLGRNGFRAVLWHQGESDANQKDGSRTLSGQLYQEYLGKLIKATRKDLSWECPWFVAQASYHTPEDPGSEDIRAAQRALWKSGLALEGPDTDALTGENRDHDGNGVHFSGKGLRAHGRAWANKVEPWLSQELQKKKAVVFVLAGQSNMQGQGVVSMDHEKHYNAGKGNLVWSMEHSQSKNKMKHLRDDQGNWIGPRNVRIRYKQKNQIRSGPLTVGYTGYGGSSHIGPELQFGHVVGEYFKDREVHLIKTAWGGKSLFKDFRPPSSKGETGKYYTKMVDEIRAGLADFGPGAYELGGFVWMQGWNDMVSQEATAEYSKNLVNFVADLRKEFSLKNLPFVVGELGNGGEAKPNSGMAKFREAQNEGVKKIEKTWFVSTKEFARPPELSPNIGHGHHWYGNAESYFLIGDALGREMIRALNR
ncbi:sialate O-acetylesterase [Akkermansiaceae bacterium]|nr:sialate O-acetylesterase [Akkermansiaceae bacterium]MDB4469637.1 sialate O-acetylesterase [Akkermansiaceae bacterium]